MYDIIKIILNYNTRRASKVQNAVVANYSSDF